MSTRLTCPGCGRTLLLPDDCTAELLSCPRCLAHIPNPQAGDTSAAVQTTPSPPPPAVLATGVQRGPRRLSSPDVDVDVRRDNRGTSALMIVLAVFGGLGVAYALSIGFALAQESKSLQPILYLLVFLAVITLISGLVVLTRPSATLGANIGRTILGVLSITGAIIVVGVLSAVAFFIFALAICLSKGGKC
jgi:hypothetical protein